MNNDILIKELQQIAFLLETLIESIDNFVQQNQSLTTPTLQELQDEINSIGN